MLRYKLVFLSNDKLEIKRVLLNFNTYSRTVRLIPLFIYLVVKVPVIL